MIMKLPLAWMLSLADKKKAWRQSRLDLAEHMYGKASASLGTLDPGVVENLADLLHEIGRNLLQLRSFDMAVKWLERALDALCSHSLERLSPDASDLRMSVLHDLGEKILLILRGLS